MDINGTSGASNGIDNVVAEESVTAGIPSTILVHQDEEIIETNSAADASEDRAGAELAVAVTEAAFAAPVESDVEAVSTETKTEPLQEHASTISIKEETTVTADGQQTTTVEGKTEKTGDDDEEEDMNVGTDEFDTPSPPKGEAITAIKKEESDSPVPGTALASAPTPAIQSTSEASSSMSAPAAAAADAKASNEEAASAFLKQTFDSLSKTNGAGPSSSSAVMKNDPEAYRNSLLARIEKDKRDGEAWLALISDTNSRADLQEMRKVYEDFFVVYPNAVRVCPSMTKMCSC
jgi:cleavage stimulation factor subunit 3